MKKILVVLLAVALIFAFAACGQQAAPAEEPAAEEGLTAIPLGGNLPDMETHNVYTLIDTPEELIFNENDQVSVYSAAGTDVPLIAVYRWAKDGRTLEEETELLAEEYGAHGYQMIDRDGACGYYCVDGEANGNYYYLDSRVFEDGDDFVEIDFYGASEEVALGDTGYYLWVPAGYHDFELTEEDIALGNYFWGEYDEAAAYPMILVMRSHSSYADQERVWAGFYPDGLPFDEATYNEWLAKSEAGEWDEAINTAYYSALGFTDIRYFTNTLEGCEYFSTAGQIQGKCACDIYLQIGEEWFNIYMSAPADASPIPNYKVITSLHTK